MAELGIFNAQSRLQDMLARRREEQQLQRDQMSKLFGNAANTRKGAAANSVAAQIGSGFGQGLATGLFGEGQQIEQARENVETEQQLQQRLGQLDPKDPESYMKIGQELNEAGLPDQGMSFIQRGQEVAASRAQQRQQKQAATMEEEKRFALADVMSDPKNTKAAKRAVIAGADPKEVRELRDFAKKSLSKFGKIAEDLGYTPGTEPFQNKVSQLILSDPSGIKIVNQMGSPPDKFVEELGKKEAQRFSEQAADAETAVKSLDALRESISLINNNDLITGIGGNFRLGLSKALAQSGLIGEDNVAATEAFFANQGNQVAQIITQFGAGTGLSDADREFAKQIAGGEISLTRDSLTKLLNLQRKYLKKGVERYNEKLSGFESDEIKTFVKPFEIPEVPIAVPSSKDDIAINQETGERIYQVDGEWVDQFGNPVE